MEKTKQTKEPEMPFNKWANEPKTQFYNDKMINKYIY